MTSDERREELRQRIAAGEQRNAARSLPEMAEDAREAASEFVRENPLAALAGAAALGLVIGSMIPGKKVSGKASALLSTLADLGLAYGTGLIDAASDAARAGQDKLEDISDAIGDEARSLKREAGYRTGKVADTARSMARKAGRKAGRSARDIKSRVSN